MSLEGFWLGDEELGGRCGDLLACIGDAALKGGVPVLALDTCWRWRLVADVEMTGEGQEVHDWDNWAALLEEVQLVMSSLRVGLAQASSCFEAQNVPLLVLDDPSAGTHLVALDKHYHRAGVGA